MAVSTTSSNSANLPVEYYERKLLVTAEPRLVLHPLGRPQRLPKNQGKQVKWLRYSRIAGSTSPLTEGTAPTEISFTTSNVTASISQYGQFAKVSDLLSFTAIDPVLSSLSERFGKAAADTIEKLIVAELDAQAAIQRVNDRADDDSIVAGDVMNHKELIEAMVSQEKDFIKPHESGKYVAVLHPSHRYDLLSDTQAGSWLDINKYVGQGRDKLMNGEFGEMYGIKLLVSDNMTEANNASSISVKKSYVIGEEAFGVVSFDQRAVKMIIKPHGSAGALDPLDQFATVGYKLMGFVAKYLEAGSKRVIQIRGAANL